MSPRVERLVEALRLSGAVGVVVQHPRALDFLTGFGEDGHERLLALFVGADGRVALVAPRLSEAQASRAGLSDAAFWADGEDPLGAVAQLRLAWADGPVLVDDALRAAHLLGLQSVWPQARFAPGGGVLGELMRNKDADEIRRMTQAAEIADAAWVDVKHTIKVGEAEREVAGRLSRAMEARGGKPTFCIVATGSMGAEPHHLSDATPVCDGDVVLCDFGCEFDGYQSDITRVVAVGAPDDEAKRVYEVVLRSHHAGAAAARPGTARAAVDQAARDVIEAAGYGECFTHRLGHGIGRNGHEEPNLTPGDPRPLQVGDCFSIEPGVYLHGRFGIRLENIYTLTEAGAVSLNRPIEPFLETVG